MNFRTVLLFAICSLTFSCKSNFSGKKLHYSTANDSGFDMVFVNDSILKIHSKSDNLEKAMYRYHFLEKEVLERMRENQPPVNFKTEKMHGQFYQEIALELLTGDSEYFNKTDTLKYVKMRIDDRMTKRIYFNGGNNFIDF